MFFIHYRSYHGLPARRYLTKIAETKDDYNIDFAIDKIYTGTLIALRCGIISINCNGTIYAPKLEKDLDLSKFAVGDMVTFISAREMDYRGARLNRNVQMLLPYDEKTESFIHGGNGISESDANYSIINILPSNSIIQIPPSKYHYLERPEGGQFRQGKVLEVYDNCIIVELDDGSNCTISYSGIDCSQFIRGQIINVDDVKTVDDGKKMI